MDVERIRRSFRNRFDELQRRDPTLRKSTIAARMGMTTRTVTNLYSSEQDKSYFELGVLRAASRALEWPEDALELIESGQADPEDMDDVPWRDEETDRITKLEEANTSLRTQMDDISDRIDELTRLVQQALHDGPAAG